MQVAESQNVSEQKLTVFDLFYIFSAIKFDAAKEERYQQEAKQRELQRIEEALQMAARRGEKD